MNANSKTRSQGRFNISLVFAIGLLVLSAALVRLQVDTAVVGYLLLILLSPMLVLLASDLKQVKKVSQ